MTSNPPPWMEPIIEGARSITADQITRFLPPEDDDTLRRGAVLMLFGEGPEGPDLLLTERAHTLRSHPGQISFPGGSIDIDETPVEAALREATEETALDPAWVDVVATLPELWLPPSNFAVTPVLAWWHTEGPVRVVDPGEVNAVLRVSLEALLEPANRVTVTHPAGYSAPGFLIGAERELLLWGFTAGLINKLFDHVGLTRPWDTSVTTEVPAFMLGVGENRA